MIPTITAARLSGAVDREQRPLLVLGPAEGAAALELWAEVAADLGDAVDVVAWDLPGHGYNAPLVPVDGDEGYDLAELAAGVVRVVDDLLTQRGDLGAACFYAGVGIGGRVGALLALESPERVLASSTLDDVAPQDRAWTLRRDLLGEDDPTPYDALLVHRTPDSRFVGLPDYPFAPRYVDVVPAGEPDLAPVRMHYLDEGPPDGPVVLLLHGQPTWSYLYRHVVPVLVDAGLRVIAPDNIGFGRSDKPASPQDYTFARHVGGTHSLVTTLDLREVTLVAQDPFTLEGRLLMIDHGMGLNSAFLHSATIVVREGQRVKQGQYLGTIGATGRATGPHLHWSLKWQDSRLDPLLFVGPMPD